MYKLEKCENGNIITERGGIVYDDLSDMNLDAQNRLVELLNEDDSRDWEAMSEILREEGLYQN